MSQRLVRRQEPGPHWIQMYVIANAMQITIAAPIHNQRLVAPAEQMSENLVPPVESRGIGAQKPAIIYLTQ